MRSDVRYISDAKRIRPTAMRASCRFALALSFLLATGGVVCAEEEPAEAKPTAPSEPPPPIYEDKLLRLSEILGGLTFLRDLCGAGDGSAWKQEMNGLLSAERPPPLRRSRLIARFNHGFETFNAVYRTCTPSAELAISRYLTEGEALASDVRSRYSQ
jgi:uncharacterized protein (TIGR02301 family)